MGLLPFKKHTLSLASITILTLALIGAILYGCPQANAQGAAAIQTGLNTAGTNAGLTTQGGSGVTLEVVIGRIINSILTLVGALLLGYLIYGGFKYMTAGGSPKGTEEAISIIKNAVIGLIIIVLSFYIADFVMRQLIAATGSGSSSGVPF